jgi:hypothetical protein
VSDSEDLAPGFIADWYGRFGEMPMSPKEIVINFSQDDISTKFDSHTDNGKSTMAGTYMRRLLDRTFEITTSEGKKTVRVIKRNRKWVVREV